MRRAKQRYIAIGYSLGDESARILGVFISRKAALEILKDETLPDKVILLGPIHAQDIEELT